MGPIVDASKQQRWIDRIQRWRKSQLSVRAFCRREQISEANFYAWRRVLRERGLIDENFQPLQQPSAFIPVTIASEPKPIAAVEVVLGDGRVLRVRPGFDAAMLLELVHLLEGRPC